MEPARLEVNASALPSGDHRGRLSVAGSLTKRCASPPAAGTLQMSPPETKAISRPSGDREGSPSEGAARAAPAITAQATSAAPVSRKPAIRPLRPVGSPA